MEMFMIDDSWKPIYFGVKCQGHESQKHCRRGSLHPCEYWLLALKVVTSSAFLQSSDSEYVLMQKAFTDRVKETLGTVNQMLSEDAVTVPDGSC